MGRKKGSIPWNLKGENKIIFQDETKTIFLCESKKYGNKEIIIDSEDWDKVKKYHWVIGRHPRRNKFYITYKDYINKTDLKLHRIILNLNDPILQGDHIDGNTLDNRKINLRICNNAENNRNKDKPKSNTSGYKGVSWLNRIDKWRAYINVNKKQIHLGLFDSKDKAAIAYNIAALKYHGEFAKLNNVMAHQ